MEFSFQTLYDHAALTAIARAIRKTYHRRKNVVTRIFMLIVLLLGVYSSTPLSGNEFRITGSNMVCYITLIFIFLTLIWEDGVTALFAKRRLKKGEYMVDAVFDDEGVAIGVSENKSYCIYQRIKYLAETKYFYIFIFSENHAEVFEKDSLSGITEEEFRKFICQKTQKEIQKV